MKITIPLFVFLVFTVIYFIGSFSRVPFGDCIGFIADTEGGSFLNSVSTHSHFLFANTLIALKNIFTGIDSIEIARTTVIMSAVICLAFGYLIIYELTNNIFSSTFGVFLFGFSFSFWRNAEIVEVYTFNLVWIAGGIYFLIKYIYNHKLFFLLVSSILIGLSLYSHIQNIFFLPALAIVLLLQKNLKHFLIFIIVIGIFILGMLMIQILNHEGVKKIFSSEVVQNTISTESIFKNLIKSIGYLFYNFWHFIPFAFFGSKFLIKKNSTIFFAMCVPALFTYLFAVIFGVSDNYVYFIPFNFIFSILSACGIYSLIDRKFIKPLAYTVILIPIFYILTFHSVLNTEVGM